MVENNHSPIFIKAVDKLTEMQRLKNNTAWVKSAIITFIAFVKQNRDSLSREQLEEIKESLLDIANSEGINYSINSDLIDYWFKLDSHSFKK